MNEHLSTDVFKWRVIHSLCAVARLVNELRIAANLVAEGRAFEGEDPYVVDGFAVDEVAHLRELRDLLSVLDKCIPVQRVQKATRSLPSQPDVSRETWPAPFNDVGDDGGSEA